MACLNRHFRIVWSECHQHWVVASEVAKGKKKSSAQSIARAAVLLGMGAALSQAALAASVVPQLTKADTVPAAGPAAATVAGNGLLLGPGSWLHLSSGASASGSMITSGGQQHVSAGAVATETRVERGGDHYVSSGGYASHSILNGGVQVVAGGTVVATEISSDGRQTLLAGAEAHGTRLNVGREIISSGGRTFDTLATQGGMQDIYAGGTASNTVLISGGAQSISGGIASNTVMYLLGGQHVYAGGTAVGTVAYEHSNQHVIGGVAVGTVMHAGNQVISQEGRSYGARLNGATQSVSSAGMAVGTILDEAGIQYVDAQNGSAQALETTVNQGGMQYVSSRGVASNTRVNSGGGLTVIESGQAHNVDQQRGARLVVSTDATVAGINSLGSFSIDNDSHVARNLLLEDGRLTVFHDGRAVDTIADGMSDIRVETGGTLDGRTQLNGRAALYGIKIKESTPAATRSDAGTQLHLAKNMTGTAVGAYVPLTKASVNIINSGDLYFNQSVSTALDSSISGTGRLYKQNAATTLLLAAPQRYTGATTVEAGALRTIVADAISQSDLVVQGGGRFELAGNKQTIKSLSGAGTVALDGAQLTLSGGSNTTNFSGTLGGKGSLVKNGSYTQTLSGRLLYGPVTYIYAGTLILDGSSGGGHLVGDVIGVSGSHLILQNGATLTGSIDPLDVTVNKASTWTMTGNSLVDTLNLGGHVDMAAPTGTLVPKQLTAINLLGTGGRITLNTALEGNASLTDKVIINGGQASGNTELAIRNAGGLGAQTSGDGILLVDAINSGTTTVDAFTLAGPVLAGAYEYSLHRGGVSDAQDWFLTSQKSNGGQTNYRAEVSLDSAVPSLALEYGSTVLGSLNERRAAQGGERVWSRIVAQETRHGGAASGVLAGDARYQSDLYLTQVGGDLYQQQQNGIDDRAGVYGAIGQSTARVDHHDGRGAGKVTLDGYSVGAYWTRSSDKGWYGDSVLQATWNDVKSHSANNLQLESDGMSWLASVEGGYRRQLGNGVLVEPQLQLAYQQLKLADGRDSAANVGFDRSDSLRTRLSVRVARDWERGDARTLSAWLRPGLVHESKGSSQTRFMTANAPTVAVQSPLSGTSLQLLAGVQGQVGKQSSVNLKASYEARLSGGTHDKYGVQLGFNTRF